MKKIQQHLVMRPFGLLLLGSSLVLSVSITPSRLQAAETGTLRGSVVDAGNEQTLEGVLVTITGVNMPGARTKETDGRGNFWFPVLPPGDYRVTFSKEGWQTIEASATVLLDQTTTLPPIRLPLIEFQMDVIEIIESAPVIDTTTSAVAINVSSDYFTRLPTPRSYQGVIRTLPGVSGRINYVTGGPGGGNPSVRGEGQEGNNYLLEGFSIRDPVSQGVAISLPTDAIQEMTIYTDGAPAEYGTFTGMAANILLKAGENETSGTARVSYDTTDPWNGLGDPMAQQSRYTNGVFTLGGAVVPDKLWYFNSASLRRGTEHQAIQLQPGESAANPEDIVLQPLPYEYLVSSRFTYNPSEEGNTLFNFTVVTQGNERYNSDSSPRTTPEAQTNSFRRVFNLNANMKSVLSDMVVFEAKWNRWRVERNILPSSGDFQTPAVEDIDNEATYENATVGIFDTRNREGLALHLTRYVVDAWGQHVVKGGYEHHDASNIQNYIFTGGPGTEAAPAISYQVDADGNPISRTEHINVGPLSHRSAIDVLFLQDQWQPMSNVTVNMGARADHFKIYAVGDLKLTEQWAYSPRLGVAWDITSAATDVLTFNAGRYYDINSLAMANWGDTVSRDYYRVCEWDPELNDYTEDFCVVQDPVLEPSVFSQKLKPYGMDKVTLGYEKVIPHQIAVGVKAIASRTFDLPEDVNEDDFFWEVRNPEIKRRDYEALELTAKHRFRDNWQFLGSYTFSRSRGMMPGEDIAGSAGNEVGVFMDNPSDPWIRGYYEWLGPQYGLDIYSGLGYDEFQGSTCPDRDTWTYDCGANDQGFYGYLPYHSFHNVKLNGSWEAPWGTELGVVSEFDSGHAYERVGYLLLYGYVTYPEGRGSRFMPPVYYLDLSVSQHFALPKERSLEMELMVFNALNLTRPLSYRTNFNQLDDWSAGLEGGDNLSYESVYFRQEPRSFQLAAQLNF